MKTSFKYRMNYIAIMVAVVSFILGTSCLLLFKTSGDSGIVGIGYCYTLLAALTNSVILLLVIFNGIRHYKDFREHLLTIVVVLANIPITFFYLNFL
jgi:hypothetical protein